LNLTKIEQQKQIINIHIIVKKNIHLKCKLS
jgi:hypothetical protein